MAAGTPANGRAAHLSPVDSSPPRLVNGFAVIFSRDVSAGRLFVLLQLRGERQWMPLHLGVPGGQIEPADKDSRAVCLREVVEETGLQIDGSVHLCKFAEGEKCDWFVMHVMQPVFAQAKDKHECADMTQIRDRLPASSQMTSFGHAWVPLEEIGVITSLQLMGGLLSKIKAAARHLQAMEGGAIDMLALTSAVQSVRLDSNIGHSEPLKQDAARSLCQQVEYYLGDKNLRGDQFFRDEIASNPDGWLQLDFIMRCNKVKAFGVTPAQVVRALGRSSEVEVRGDLQAIRRVGNRPPPDFELRSKAGKGAHKGKVRVAGKGGGKFYPPPGRGKGLSKAGSLELAQGPANMSLSAMTPPVAQLSGLRVSSTSAQASFKANDTSNVPRSCAAGLSGGMQPSGKFSSQGVPIALGTGFSESFQSNEATGLDLAALRAALQTEECDSMPTVQAVNPVPQRAVPSECQGTPAGHNHDSTQLQQKVEALRQALATDELKVAPAAQSFNVSRSHERFGAEDCRGLPVVWNGDAMALHVAALRTALEEESQDLAATAVNLAAAQEAVGSEACQGVAIAHSNGRVADFNSETADGPPDLSGSKTFTL